MTGKTPKQQIEAVLGERFSTEDGDTYAIDPQPGMSAEEYAAFAARFPLPPPGDIRELLLFTSGFTVDPVDEVDFTGRLMFEFEEAFPHGVPLASDGFGNFWVVDVNPESGAWAPIYFACHDPPVIAYQATDVTEFLGQLFEGARTSAGPVQDVHDAVVRKLWQSDEGLLTVDEAGGSADKELRRFVADLPDAARIADLRAPQVGEGFAWGRHGPNTTVRRAGVLPLFAIIPPEKKPGLWQRLFSRS